MSENNFEIIQNRLDALVDKIIQKENTDEDFRITYAQILEKINTKIDVFANIDNTEQIGTLSREIGAMLRSRQEIIDSKFDTIKNEFDNLNRMLAESIKTPELLGAFNKIQNQIHYFSEEQENQKASFNSIISHIEKFGTLHDTNEILNTNFGIIKEQNTFLKEQLDEISKFNTTIEESNQNILDETSAITFKIKEITDQINEKSSDTQNFITEKISSIITKIQETDASIETINNNLTTLIKVIGDLFSDEEFQDLKDDVASIIAKTEFVSEILKKLATKEEIVENAVNNKTELKSYILDTITQLENNIFTKINTSELSTIKDYTEKVFFQGTEVLKEEVWNIKDTVTNIQNTVLKTTDFQENIKTLKDDITDVISVESVATSDQIKDLTTTLLDTKNEIASLISNDTNITSKQIENIISKLNTVKEEINIASSQSNTIKNDILDQINSVKEDIGTVVNKNDSLKEDLSNIILKDQNEQIAIALQNLQTKFVTQLVQIADNISFEENTDEINDNIASVNENITQNLLETTDLLKQSLSTEINELHKDVKELKDVSNTDSENLTNLLYTINNNIQADVQDSINDLTSQFKLLTNGLKDGKEDYAYTLPDIESDLSKIRLELNTIQKTLINPESITQDHSVDISTKINELKTAVQKMQESPISQQVTEIKELFRGLTEDISSISKRTNKLIISSDEVNKRLLFNIDVFTSLITAFEKQSRSFYNSAFLKEMNTKIERMAKETKVLVQSDEAMNEAFVYMGEWIDSASDIFDNLQADVQKIKKNIVSDDENLPEKVENNLAIIKQRLDEQDCKISKQQTDIQEMKSLMEYIASQVSATNEKLLENEQSSQKISNIEKQLKKIEKNIAIITEYIDEDENYD